MVTISIKQRAEMYKDNPEETLHCAGILGQIFYYELKYVVFKALKNPEIDVVKEMDKVEKLYRFNDTMNMIMDSADRASNMRRNVIESYYDTKTIPDKITIGFINTFYDGVHFSDLNLDSNNIDNGIDKDK